MKQEDNQIDSWLAKVLYEKRSIDPTYSLRQFSRELQIPPGPLSELLNQKRNLSDKVARKICAALKYDELATEAILKMTRNEKEARCRARRHGLPRKRLTSSFVFRVPLPLEHWSEVSGILEEFEERLRPFAGASDMFARIRVALEVEGSTQSGVSVRSDNATHTSVPTSIP